MFSYIKMHVLNSIVIPFCWQNLGSDFFIVKGIEIGQEVVSAQLFEPQFEHVIDMITLTVAEAMSLEPPSPILVTVGVLVKFKLKVFRQKVAQGTFSNRLSGIYCLISLLEFFPTLLLLHVCLSASGS